MSSSSPVEARSLASRALTSLAYGYGAICAPAIILAPAFFRYWIGADFASVAAPVAEILFLGAWINGLAFVPYFLLQSQGRPDVTGKLHAAEVLPFVGVLWGLTSAFGIAGAAAAWSLRCAADAVCLFWAARYAETRPCSGASPLLRFGRFGGRRARRGTESMGSPLGGGGDGLGVRRPGLCHGEDLRRLALAAKARAARLYWRSSVISGLARTVKLKMLR